MDNEKRFNELMAGLEASSANHEEAAKAVADIKASNEDLASRLESAEKALADVQAAQIERAQGIKQSDEFTADAAKNFSLTRLVNAIVSKDWRGAGLEKEYCEEAQRIRDERAKAMGVATDTAGGFLVPEMHNGEQFIDVIYANSQIAERCTQLRDLTQDVINIPGMSTGATAAWFAEGDSLTAADQVLINKTLSPNKLATRIVVNNELFRRGTTPAVDQLMFRDIARAFASELDRAILEGSGASNQPLGISNDATVIANVIDGGGTLVHGSVTALISEVATRNHLNPSCAFVMDTAAWKELMDLADGQSRPLYVLTQANAPGGRQKVGTLLGYDVIVTENATAGEVLFGDFGETLVGTWGGLRIDASSDAGFANDQTQIRAIQEADVVVRHSEAYSVSTGAAWTA